VFCGAPDIEKRTAGSVVVASCQVCHGRFSVEFGPKDEPGTRARIAMITPPALRPRPAGARRPQVN